MAEAPRVALVTGASTGLGKACVQKLVADGFHVFAGCRTPEACEQDLQAGCAEQSGSLTVVKLDVRRDEDVEAAFKTISEKAGRLDVLINNAGILIVGTVEMVTVASAQEMFDTNFFGSMRCMHAALPVMREQKSGCIVNVSSVIGEIPTMNQPMYAASKAALDAMTLGTCGAVKDFGIRCHSFQPGGISDTAIGANLKNGDRLAADANPYDIDALVQESIFDKIIPHAQTSAAVAAVIADIVAGRITDPVVQSSDYAKQMVGEKLKDITGDHVVKMRY